MIRALTCTPTSLLQSVVLSITVLCSLVRKFEQTEIERMLVVMMVLYTARLVTVMNAGHKQNFCGKGRCPNKRVAYSVSTRSRGQLMLSCVFEQMS
jgi:hypothetical protein